MLWTIQSRNVMQIMDEEGIYFPDFEKSDMPSDSRNLYYEVLNAFNRINQTDYKGLVFCFSFAISDGKFFPIITKTQFDQYITNTRLKDMLNQGKYNVFCNSSSLLKIKAPDFYNPLNISYLDFCDLIPPSFFLSEEQVEVVHKYINHGISKPPIIEGQSFIQCHIPFLCKDMIIERYDGFLSE